MYQNLGALRSEQLTIWLWCLPKQLIDNSLTEIVNAVITIAKPSIPAATSMLSIGLFPLKMLAAIYERQNGSLNPTFCFDPSPPLRSLEAKFDTSDRAEERDALIDLLGTEDAILEKMFAV